MNKLLTLLLICISSTTFSQERRIDLTFNPYLDAEDDAFTRTGNSIDSTFQEFTYANINLPVLDDFSENKFVKYDNDYSAAGVSSVLYYMLMNAVNTVPLASDVKLCDSTHAHADTIVIDDGIIQSNSTYFTTGFDIFVNDLNSYPIDGNGQIRKVYNECYITVDSIIIIGGIATNTIQDTIWFDGRLTGDEPDYAQDSARIFSAIKNDPSKIWIDNYACHNYRYAVNPKSLGVVTFDGVSNNGYPYEWGAINSYGDADVLTSKPINLAGKTGVFLTFFYQSKGLGNAPEPMDSLCLDVYSPSLDKWFESNLWSTPGNVVVDEWHTGHVQITQSSLLEDGFQFRFRNKATLTGVLDHWHIDYVRVRDGIGVTDVAIDDIAISEPIESFLIDYTAAPWEHYKNLVNRDAVMLDSIELKVNNSHTTPKIQTLGGMLFNGMPYVIPNNPSIEWPIGIAPYKIDVNLQSIVFPNSFPGDTMANFDVKINISTASSNILYVNDTIRFTQSFKNFYAYDDGSAENGYGLQNNNALLAYKFDAYEADTLTGVLMKFIPTNINVTNEIFLLTIWKDNNGEPGDIIYQDDFFNPHYPIYSGKKNSYKYYTFNDDQAITVPETFYVGWEQINNTSLYVGMDLNNDNSDKIFYNIGSNWVNTSFAASLIIRPVFSTGLNSTLSTEEKKVEINISVYPNPTQELVTISGLSTNEIVELRDLSGRIMMTSTEKTINLNNFANGVYIISVYSGDNQLIYSDKLIKY